MVSIPEQIQAQFSFISAVASHACEGAEKIIALNVDATRASVDKTSATLRQLMQARDAGEIFALCAIQGQPNFERMFAYGRGLVDIAAHTQNAWIDSIGFASGHALASPAARAIDTLAIPAALALPAAQAPAAPANLADGVEPAAAPQTARSRNKAAIKPTGVDQAGAVAHSAATPEPLQAKTAAAPNKQPKS
ncbi:MAG: phasin family protein [Pseudomonadota bacterium]